MNYNPNTNTNTNTNTKHRKKQTKKSGTYGRKMGLLHAYKTMYDRNGQEHLVHNSQVLDKLLENWHLELYQARLKTNEGQFVKISLKHTVHTERQHQKLIYALQNGWVFANPPKTIHH